MILAEHATRPGFTSRGYERSGSYDRLAAAVSGRVLDLACGDGVLLPKIPGAVGVDLSREELALADGPVVRGRAQALPFAAGSFDTVACHLAFMLFDDLERVVAELDRVLAPGGMFVAVMGGGPVAEPAPDDAYPRFIARMTHAPMVGDRRARSPQGWRELFAGWLHDEWERHELVLDGSVEEVSTFLASNYGGEHVELDGTPPIRCRAVTWLARVVKR